MPFKKILGQESAIATLQNALRGGRLAHAYLFLGPGGVGKRLTALTLAKAMNCQSPPEAGESCEQCPSCGKVNSSNHVDVILTEPDGEVIKIDQVREMQKRLQYRPLEGGRRACIIDSADSLNEAAANALLKTLEEPPEETHLILVTSRPHLLLPTIRSRCQWIKFRPLSRDSIVQILKTISSMDVEKANFFASLAGGSVGQALALSDRVDFQKRSEWLRTFSEIPQKTTEEIFEACERLAREEEGVHDLLDLWKLWIRDLVVCQIQGAGHGERLINRDLQEQLSKDAQKYSWERLDGLFQLITDVQKSLALNVNRQLALETLLFEMRKSSAKKDFLRDAEAG